MPKDIKNADAKLLHKTLKDVVDKYGNKRGSRPRQQLQDYDTVIKAVMKRISDLSA